MRLSKTLAPAIMVVICFSFLSFSGNAETLSIKTISELDIIAFERIDAKANLISFIGGKGLRNSEGRTRNFLGTQSKVFFESGYNYYLYPNVDSHSKATYPYRLSEDNIDRIRALVEFLKQRNSLPTILIGFSRGSVDVSAYSNQHKETIKGIVLMSGIYLNNSRKASEYSIDKIVGDNIEVPFLIVHHENDQCRVSNPDEAAAFFGSVISQTKAIAIITGGGGTGRECGPFHHHGYEDVEAAATSAVLKWLKILIWSK